MKAKGIAILLAGAMSACSNPIDSGDPADDEPAVTYYDIQVNLWRIEVQGDCDANVLGVPNQGEFAYEVRYSLQEEDGTWGDPGIIVSSSLFGSPDAKHVQRNTGETIQFENGDDARFTLAEGLNYEIEFEAMEWDGSDIDGRMKGSGTTKVVSADSAGLELSLVTGSEPECRVELKGNTVHQIGEPPEEE